MTQIDTTAVINAVRFAEQVGDPATPAAGYWATYFKAAGLYYIDDAGVVTGPIAGRILISEQTPTGTGTVTWSSIPATYKSLEIEVIARSNRASEEVDNASLWFNNDTTATNYRQAYLEYKQTTIGTNAGDQSFALQVAAANAPANSCTAGFVKIINYASTTFNKYYAGWDVVRRDSTTNHLYRHDWNAEWESTAAINRVDIILGNGQYIAGTTFRLYGVY